MPSFYLNYGGPGFDSGLVDGAENIKRAYSECHEVYGKPHRKLALQFEELPGLVVTVHTDGIHRSLTVELDGAVRDRKSLAAYRKLKNAANEECYEEYNFFGHNCVRATASVISALNEHLKPENRFSFGKYTFGTKTFVPWNLDAMLKRYIKRRPSILVTVKEDAFAEFKERYNESIHKSHYSFFVANNWQNRSITSADDIIGKAYGHRAGKGERTKSVLLEMGWVTEDENQMLHPTDKAPKEFQDGLNSYNQDLYTVQWLKEEFIRQGASPKEVKKLFRHDPDTSAVLQKLQYMETGKIGKIAQTTLNAYTEKEMVEAKDRNMTKIPEEVPSKAMRML
jgi:hypothetical protein